MSQALIVCENRQGVRRLQINRPQAANALDEALHLALQHHLNAAALDAQVQCVVLSSAGERTFCAGADLKEFSTLAPLEAAQRRRRLLLDTLLCLIDFPKPLIAQVGGAAVGAGAMLALACDEIVATPSARFHFPEIDLGMASPMGCLMVEWRAGAQVAQSMLQWGKPCIATQAHAQAWVHVLHPADVLAQAVWASAEQRRASAAFAVNKQWLHAPWRMRLLQAAEAAEAATAANNLSGN